MSERSEDDTAARTRTLLEAAERVSRQLEAQNQRLSEAIEMFHQEVLTPLRKGETPGALQ